MRYVRASEVSAWIGLALLPVTGASAHHLTGHVRDASGLALPHVAVDAWSDGVARATVSDAHGAYALELPSGRYRVSFRRPGFATTVHEVQVEPGRAGALDASLAPAVSAALMVTAKGTFRNLAEVDAGGAELVGVADTASEGVVSGRQMDGRPVYRVGEVLEAVPGVVISQHSGEGKANQYYVRGFNIDHGTDLATTVAGVPANMPTHAHGQGYADVSFLIPELVSAVQFRKGPYFADEGDFSSAGAIHVRYANTLDRPFAALEGGQGRYGRALVAGSSAVGGGHVLYAGEALHHDGPWESPDGYRKLNGVLRYSRGTGLSGSSLTAMAYDGRWNSTDQAPQRAFDSGALSRFGPIDTTDGGSSQRLSLSGAWRRSTASGTTDLEVYALRYRLNLFSNFTYFLDDPHNGDQFEQEDRRHVYGAGATHRWLSRWVHRDVESQAGLQLRADDIPTIGLHHTRARVRLSPVREDAVRQANVGAHVQTRVQWTPWLRTIVGLRADAYRFRVTSAVAANSGTDPASRLGPKLAVALGPWRGTEVYASFGDGFHSNDGRGATIRVDPQTLEPARRVDPLARARGAEIGVRTTAVRGLHSALTAWGLDIASELVFVGDAGTTDESRASRRWGVEWANYVNVTPWLVLDADLAWSHARFRAADRAGDRIPGAVEGVASAGVTVHERRGLSGALRLRYFGPRPLVEDDSVRSRASAVITARLAYALSDRYTLGVEAFNLADARASDIDYFYVSRLPGEPAEGVADVHTHPLEPRAFRISLNARF